jgi:hypothetical protein
MEGDDVVRNIKRWVGSIRYRASDSHFEVRERSGPYGPEADMVTKGGERTFAASANV